MRKRVCLLAAALTVSLAPSSHAAPQRVVHRYTAIAISPDGKNVASVEGDASPWGGEPVVRALVIRSVDGKRTIPVALPCNGLHECWPSSPVWSADGKTLTFAMRRPGTHARSIYTVAADGTLTLTDSEGDIESGAISAGQRAGARERCKRPESRDFCGSPPVKSGGGAGITPFECGAPSPPRAHR